LDGSLKLRAKLPPSLRPKARPGKPTLVRIGPHTGDAVAMLAIILFEGRIPLEGSQPRPFSLYIKQR
jgi:hypothetical protein